jgi:hypothetical protein
MGNKQNSTSQATILKEKDKRVVVPQVKESTKVKNILDRNHFDFLYVVGRGGFGKVYYFSASLTKNINKNLLIYFYKTIKYLNSRFGKLVLKRTKR